ncbi:MAG: prephenate dehydrogenase [Nitrospiria bacterium]
MFKQITIIGVGLIGGSLGLALKKAQVVKQVVGYGRRRGALHKAVALHAIDRYYLTLPKALSNADLVVLATPVGTFEKICQAMSPHLQEGCVVTDVGSAKGQLVSRIENLMPSGVHFVGGHPIAGREKSGVMAASDLLFQGCRTILTPNAGTNRKALGKIKGLWKAVGSMVSEMDPFEHDRILAMVSHLPHFVAYALMEVLTHPKVADLDPVRYSAGGLRDFTRIAASSAEMWRDIFLHNREAMIEAIDLYQETIEKIKKMIISKNGEALIDTLEAAKTVRQRSSSR